MTVQAIDSRSSQMIGLPAYLLKSPTRLTNLKLSMFVTTDKPHKFHPFLNCKGAECKHLLPALEWVCRRSLVGRPGKHHETQMAEALAALSELVALFDILLAMSSLNLNLH